MIIHHTNALADGIGALREGINDGMRMAAYAQNIKDAKLRREQRQEQETREQAGETRAAEMHALSMASTQANQEEQTGLRPLRMRQAQAQTGALEAQSKIAQSDASYRSNYDQASAADPELKIVDKGMQDLLRQTEEQYGEALPPEVKQRFQERVETMREIQGRTPQERTQSRARYGDESQQFLQSEMKPHAEKRAKNLIGTLVDNQEFQKDPLAFQALSQLQQAVSKPARSTTRTRFTSG